MSNKNYSIITGKFSCKTCSKEVLSARFWNATGEVTWMCSDKHLSKVGLIPQKKKKKDFINE